MLTVSEKEKVNLLTTFPIFKNKDLENEATYSQFYKTSTLFRFDHWISNSNENELILNFPEQIRITKKLKEYYKEEEKFISIYKKIFCKYKIYDYWESEEDDSNSTYDSYEFSEFESKEEFIDICKDSLREKKFAKLFHF